MILLKLASTFMGLKIFMIYEIPDKEETRCKKVFVDSTGNKKETAVKHEMKK